MEEIDEQYKEIAHREEKLDIPSYEGYSTKNEPFYGDDEPAF